MKRYYYEKYRQTVVEYPGYQNTYYYCNKPFIYFNKTYPSGYYTKNKFYRNIGFTNSKSYIKCYRCNKKFKSFLDENNEMYCPNCNHKIKISKIDKLKKKFELSDLDKTKVFVAFACVFVLIFLLISIIVYNNVIEPTQFQREVTASTEKPTTMYFKELGRTCKILGYNSYYDADTNCYFKFDTDRHPSQWMYYYVGISDQYEDDYGWMIYNNYLGKWQINIGLKKWKDYIDTDNELWHFKNSYKYELETEKN